GDFAHAAYPLWSEDGKYVLTLGTWHSDVPEKEFDAWIVEIEGSHSKGSPKKTGLFPALRAKKLYRTLGERPRIEVADWRDGWLYLTLPAGEGMDLFRIRLRPDVGTIQGDPQRLTVGAGSVRGPRVAKDGKIAFARTDIAYDLFSLAVPSRKEL